MEASSGTAARPPSDHRYVLSGPQQARLVVDGAAGGEVVDDECCILGRERQPLQSGRGFREGQPYEVPVSDMLQRTGTTCAPRTILEADCILHARIKALRTAAEALESALKRA
jgi:hypothetical protein